MVFITESRRGSRPRRNRQNFGKINRGGQDFDEVQIECEDLKRMLDTPDHELKNKIYDLLRVMEENEHRRNREYGYGRVSRSEDPYKEQEYSHAADPYAKQRRHIPHNTMFDGTGVDPASMGIYEHKLGVESKPKPDSSGLLWTSED